MLGCCCHSCVAANPNRRTITSRTALFSADPETDSGYCKNAAASTYAEAECRQQYMYDEFPFEYVLETDVLKFTVDTRAVEDCNVSTSSWRTRIRAEYTR